MHTFNICLLMLAYLFMGSLSAQNQKRIELTSEKWTAVNRTATFSPEEIHLDAQGGNGLLWLNDTEFGNGTIELDIKGVDVRGKSFVGVAIHGSGKDVFDAIYFRPFNFTHPQRNTHSVQYISIPEYDWSLLRTNFPDTYENKINPVPNPNEWFHVKITVDYPEIKVYVDAAKEPSLVIEQLSKQKKGMIGLWTGNGSEGWFKNLLIQHK